jgi:hypothetical protein
MEKATRHPNPVKSQAYRRSAKREAIMSGKQDIDSNFQMSRLWCATYMRIPSRTPMTR